MSDSIIVRATKRGVSRMFPSNWRFFFGSEYAFNTEEGFIHISELLIYEDDVSRFEEWLIRSTTPQPPPDDDDKPEPPPIVDPRDLGLIQVRIRHETKPQVPLFHVDRVTNGKVVFATYSTDPKADNQQDKRYTFPVNSTVWVFNDWLTGHGGTVGYVFPSAFLFPQEDMNKKLVDPPTGKTLYLLKRHFRKVG